MKVVVIGAGIVGASVAFHLADAGVEVVVVDEDRPGRATRAGAGIVSFPGRSSSPGEPIFELSRRAFEAYPAIVAAIGGGPGLFDVIGELVVGPPGELDAVHVKLASLGSVGTGAVTLLDEAATSAAFPYLRSDFGAVHVPTTARVDGEVVRSALLGAAGALGARVVTGPADLEVGGGRVTGVGIGEDREVADAVVVAAGAWTGEMARLAGVDLAVDAQRGQILHLTLPGADTSRLPVVHPLGAPNYLLPFPDGRIVAGATREAGSGFDPRLTAGGVAQVLNEALVLAPGLAVATLGELRVGLRPVTPDGNPLLGPVAACLGLWSATGMGPSGLSLGPYSGALVARWVMGHRPEMDMAPFAPDRSFA
jgi:D-amino-acid dehydrogenase